MRAARHTRELSQRRDVVEYPDRATVRPHDEVVLVSGELQSTCEASGFRHEADVRIANPGLGRCLFTCCPSRRSREFGLRAPFDDIRRDVHLQIISALDRFPARRIA